MPTDDLESLLRAAFEARASVVDDLAPPPPRFAKAEPTRRQPGRRWAAPLAAAAAVVVLAGGAAVLSRTPTTSDRSVRTTAGRTTSVSTSASPSPNPSSGPAAVHITLLNGDGATYGVGMPVIAYFSRTITDARALQRATVATVAGRPVHGAWFFERSAAGHGPIEGHFRLASYWPAHSRVTVALRVDGLSAGAGLTYDDSVSVAFRTGARTVATVDDRAHRLTVISDGRTTGRYPVSLGAATRPGVAVIMEKPGTVTMTISHAPTHVRDAQRLTYGGEFLVAAPWNTADIEDGIDSSNGSIELRPNDANELFAALRIGDPVTVSGVDGPALTIGSGYGDWNVPWTVWLDGGLVRTR